MSKPNPKHQINADRMDEVIHQHPGIKSGDIKKLLDLSQQEFWTASGMCKANRGRAGISVIYWHGAKKPDQRAVIKEADAMPVRKEIAELLKDMPILTRWIGDKYPKIKKVA